MSTESASVPRPGVVIFAALLNFVSAVLAFLGSAVVLLVMILGLSARLAARTSSYAPELANVNWAPLLQVLGITLFVGGLLLAVQYVWLGASLLGGKKTAWYIQVVFSILGLFAVPVGTVINAVILILFFQDKTRALFGIK